MYEAEQFPTMSDREKYLFDLQGFLVVRGLLSTDEVKRLNEAVDANRDKHGEHTARAVGPELEGTHLRGHINGMLTWGPPLVSALSRSVSPSQAYPLSQYLTRSWLEAGPTRPTY